MFYKIQALVYRKDELTAISLLGEMLFFIESLPAWPEKPGKWLIANSASKLVAIENNRITVEAIDLVDSYIDKKEDISIVLAGEDEDDSILTIWYKNTPSVSHQRYTLSFTIKSLVCNNSSESFLEIIKRIVSFRNWEFKYITLDTEQYKRKQRSVFSDRLSVGWMLYLPAKIEHEIIPSASSVVYLLNGPGTIVISKNTFNGKDPSDIDCANNVEIELAANGLLPLIKEL